MTCSLKACSYGLNLTAASRVFLLDPWYVVAVAGPPLISLFVRGCWSVLPPNELSAGMLGGTVNYRWNPAIEEQAIGRAHRIGQCETVKVYRLFIASSVEQRILKLQDDKASLAASAMGDAGGAVRKSQLSAQDLMQLFNVNAHGDIQD